MLWIRDGWLLQRWLVSILVVLNSTCSNGWYVVQRLIESLHLGRSSLVVIYWPVFMRHVFALFPQQSCRLYLSLWVWRLDLLSRSDEGCRCWMMLLVSKLILADFASLLQALIHLDGLSWGVMRCEPSLGTWALRCQMRFRAEGNHVRDGLQGFKEKKKCCRIEAACKNIFWLQGLDLLSQGQVTTL